MYVRRAAVIVLLVCANGVISRAADDAKLDKQLKALAGSDAAAQLQATDDMVEMGPAAKSAVPALIKALASSDPNIAMACSPRTQRDWTGSQRRRAGANGRTEEQRPHGSRIFSQRPGRNRRCQPTSRQRLGGIAQR